MATKNAADTSKQSELRVDADTLTLDQALEAFEAQTLIEMTKLREDVDAKRKTLDAAAAAQRAALGEHTAAVHAKMNASFAADRARAELIQSFAAAKAA